MKLLKIKKITKLNKKNDRYDLTINQTHNFYANEILIHNTSFRCSYAKTIRQLSKYKQWINRIYPIFNNEKWEYVNGTRRVVLFEEQNDKEGFHGSEQFRFDVFDQLKPHLNKGMVIYGEIVGWANGSTIMPVHDITKLKDKKYEKKYGKQIVYKYGCLDNQLKFIIYRITLTTDDGTTLDYTPAQIESWCIKRGLNFPIQVCDPFIYDGNTEKLRNLVEELTERPDCLTQDYYDPSHISEGVVIRVDCASTLPMFYKNKSWVFKLMEGIAKENEVDMEDAA